MKRKTFKPANNRTTQPDQQQLSCIVLDLAYLLSGSHYKITFLKTCWAFKVALTTLLFNLKGAILRALSCKLEKAK